MVVWFVKYSLYSSTLLYNFKKNSLNFEVFLHFTLKFSSLPTVLIFQYNNVSIYIFFNSSIAI